MDTFIKAQLEDLDTHTHVSKWPEVFHIFTYFGTKKEKRKFQLSGWRDRPAGREFALNAVALGFIPSTSPVDQSLSGMIPRVQNQE